MSAFMPVPPPPMGPGAPELAPQVDANGKSVPKPRPKGNRFDADVDISELDDRLRPGLSWPARTRELSRSNIVVVSRRMCYPNRLVVIAVHRIDSRPVPLFARVIECEYETDGLYRVDLDLLPIPPQGPVADWAIARAGK